MRVEVDRHSFRRAVDSVLERIAKEMTVEVKEEIVRKDAIYRGYLIKSIRYVKHSWKEYDVGSDCPYAAIVEYGAEPHRPPFKAIYDWVVIKLGVPLGEAESVTWRIVRKIEREGTNPKPYLVPGALEVWRRYGGRS